jgi:uncharacterized protein
LRSCAYLGACTLPASSAPTSRRPPVLVMNPKLIVIDTQSLFDWLVFRNPLCKRWAAALEGEEWQWTFTSLMKSEFDFVAAKGFGERWPVDAESVAAAWSRHAREVPVPPPMGLAARLRCTDPDDQKFIDLAILAGAHTLVTRDKALLRLARKALERHGVRVCKPDAWHPEGSGISRVPAGNA